MTRGHKFIVLIVLAAGVAGFLTWRFVLGSSFIGEFHVLPGSLQSTKNAAPFSNEVSQAMTGKRITIRGKLWLGKIGWYVLLDNRQEVYLPPAGSSAWQTYHEMQGKLVKATGTLRFFQCPKDYPLTDKKGRVIDRCTDYYFFETETDQPQIIPERPAR